MSREAIRLVDDLKNRKIESIENKMEEAQKKIANELVAKSCKKYAVLYEKMVSSQAAFIRALKKNKEFNKYSGLGEIEPLKDLIDDDKMDAIAKNATKEYKTKINKINTLAEKAKTSLILKTVEKDADLKKFLEALNKL